jgi:hypothetical protein
MILFPPSFRFHGLAAADMSLSDLITLLQPRTVASL